MALSNTMQTPPGKALGLGDKQATPATGLDFLASEAAEATDAQPKQGVSFAALVQTIARTVLPAARKADAVVDAPAPYAQGNSEKPDNPVALLALALQGEKHADRTASPEPKAIPKIKMPDSSTVAETVAEDGSVVSDIPAVVTKNGAKQPHEGWHLGKRIHELKQRILAENAANLPATTTATPASIEAADTAEPIADMAPDEAATSGTADHSVAVNLVAQQPAVPSAAPIVSEKKSPQRIEVTGKQTPGAAERVVTTSVVSENKSPEQNAIAAKQAPVASDKATVAPEIRREETGKPKSEAIGFAQVIEPDYIQNKSPISAVNIQKSKDLSEKSPIPTVLDPESIPVVPDADGKATAEVKSSRLMAAAEAMQAVMVPQAKNGPKIEAPKADMRATEAKEVQTPRSEHTPVLRMDAVVRDVQPPQPTSPAQLATITTNVAGALNSQVVDMGVSGQWIDDIARQIASIGANPGHGSFRIESQALGGVRVDIAPSVHGTGSDVLMRVDNDAAFAALDKDRERLMQDARMASVRIGELRIDRLASAQDAQGSGSSTSQQQGNSAGQQGNQQAMSQSNAQSGGQMDNRGGQQSAHQDAAAMSSQRDGQNNPKAPFTNAVMNGTERDDASRNARSSRSDTARYA